jgi:exonuclease VII small subunit
MSEISTPSSETTISKENMQKNEQFGHSYDDLARVFAVQETQQLAMDLRGPQEGMTDAQTRDAQARQKKAQEKLLDTAPENKVTATLYAVREIAFMPGEKINGLTFATVDTKTNQYILTNDLPVLNGKDGTLTVGKMNGNTIPDGSFAIISINGNDGKMCKCFVQEHGKAEQTTRLIPTHLVQRAVMQTAPHDQMVAHMQRGGDKNKALVTAFQVFHTETSLSNNQLEKVIPTAQKLPIIQPYSTDDMNIMNNTLESKKNALKDAQTSFAKAETANGTAKKSLETATKALDDAEKAFDEAQSKLEAAKKPNAQSVAVVTTLPEGSAANGEQPKVDDVKTLETQLENKMSALESAKTAKDNAIQQAKYANDALEKAKQAVAEAETACKNATGTLNKVQEFNKDTTPEKLSELILSSSEDQRTELKKQIESQLTEVQNQIATLTESNPNSPQLQILNKTKNELEERKNALVVAPNREFALRFARELQAGMYPKDVIDTIQQQLRDGKISRENTDRLIDSVTKSMYEGATPSDAEKTETSGRLQKMLKFAGIIGVAALCAFVKIGSDGQVDLMYMIQTMLNTGGAGLTKEDRDFLEAKAKAKREGKRQVTVDVTTGKTTTT